MYKITAVTSETVFSYTANVYRLEGDYLILTYGNNKSIINLTKFVTVEVEGVGNDKN